MSKLLLDDAQLLAAHTIRDALDTHSTTRRTVNPVSICDSTIEARREQLQQTAIAFANQFARQAHEANDDFPVSTFYEQCGLDCDGLLRPLPEKPSRHMPKKTILVQLTEGLIACTVHANYGCHEGRFIKRVWVHEYRQEVLVWKWGDHGHYIPVNREVYT